MTPPRDPGPAGEAGGSEKTPREPATLSAAFGRAVYALHHPEGATVSEYQPELGQMAFGQPHQRYEASALLIAALRAVEEELCRVMGNRHQREYESPFINSGNRFECGTFKAHAYSWDETVPQEFNFAWRDLRVSWYKWVGRGASTNREVTPDEIAVMLDDCLAAAGREDDNGE